MEEQFEELDDYRIGKNFRCPYCKKRIGARALEKEERKVIDQELEMEEKMEAEMKKIDKKFPETVQVKKRLKYVRNILRKNIQKKKRG